MDPSAPDDVVSPAPRRSSGFGRVLFSAILSGVLVAGVIWAITHYVLKSPYEDWRLYVWVALGGIASRLLLWPLSGRRVPGLVLELLSIAVFILVSYAGYVYVWPAIPLHLLR